MKIQSVIRNHGVRLSALWLSVGLLFCGAAQAQLTYDSEYPALGYGKVAPHDRFSALLQDLQSGALKLDASIDGSVYLASLLQALDIDPSSQVLVFSKTSLKQRFISGDNPRALYFNDEIYVGYTPGSRTLEVAALDPVQGAVFFDFQQDVATGPSATQETGRCLRCHDSYSMTGGGVPRLMLSSGLVAHDGNIVSHEISEITTTATPIARRWGGLYVTGTSGTQPHMGNLFVENQDSLAAIDTTTWGNRTSLDEFVQLGAYLRPTSDIVALLVLEHQLEVQNALTRLSFESRTQLGGGETQDAKLLDELTTPLLDALFMAHEAPLGDKIEGTSGYTEWFESQGPSTADGRSLRELDLQTRTFHYPLSYLIYSPAIDALPEAVRLHLFSRIRAVLQDAPSAPDYPFLNADLRGGISAILRETKPEILQ
ncbi:MAG: hypothetical protein LBE21_00705 [Pseudomonadales bacterium]|nr:hypothetical protein [Pseudomonadales bacterium]